MHPDTETILDRRRMRRRVSLWRSLAILGLVLAVGAFALRSEPFGGVFGPHHIARVAIEGTITDDRAQLELIKRIGEAKAVDGVLLFVNSPGGTTTGGESLYEALRELGKSKPVVAQFGTLAASAGYIVGLSADHIVARGNTITGSVGVLIQWPEVTQLLDKVGVKMNAVKSGVLKATPNPFEPLDEASLQVTQEMVSDGFRWFLSLVEERRGIKAAAVPGLDQGRIFSGRAALEHKLVDAIGGEAEAVRWLVDNRGVGKDLKVIDWKPAQSGIWGLSAALSGVVQGLLGEGAGGLGQVFARAPGLATVGLDGLVSVWQPSEK